MENNIQAARLSKGITQKELADYLKTNVSTLSKIENGRDTSGSRLCMIADYLDVSIDYLLKRI